MPTDPNQQKSATLPLAVIEQLRTAASELGIDLPGAVNFAPTINVTMPIRALAYEVGRLVRLRDIFIRADEIGTISPKGEWKKMTPKRFAGWIEEFAVFTSGSSRRVRESITPDEAAQILEIDIFRESLRPLESINTMRLPIRRSAAWQIELLPIGYDTPSRIFTIDLLEYDHDWTLDQARDFLDDHGKDYPWASPSDDPVPLRRNRSWAVQIAIMLGTFCRAFFPPGTPKPMVAIIGNQAGTGKSTLVAMALMPVFGHASAGKMCKDDEAMDKELETAARTYASYLFIDDIGGGIFSSPLNRFITASSHAGRCMGGNSEMFRVPNVTQVFVTGNDIKVSGDLMRRALCLELHLATEVRGRTYTRSITPLYLARPEIRKQFLSALWAIVHLAAEYIATDPTCPMPAGLESFEDYTTTISFLTQSAGYADPLVLPDLSGAGNEEETEMSDLLIDLATRSAANTSFTRLEMVEAARTLGVLESLVGLPGDKDLDQNQMKRWGRQLQRWRGRELTDAKGRRFQFSRRRMTKGATYPLTFI
jgi:hypothetical protein